jgi:hypothetical protein
VVDVDARVDDVGAGALAGSLVKGVSGAAGLGAGDAGEAPGGVLLGGGDGDDAILLDEVDLLARVSGSIFTKRGCREGACSRWGRSGGW